MSDEQLSAQVLFERGKDFFQQGDFVAARRDFRQVLEAAPGEELEGKASEMLKRCSLDPVEFGVGIAVLLLIIALFVSFGR